jgi:hypothetical protein
MTLFQGALSKFITILSKDKLAQLLICRFQRAIQLSWVAPFGQLELRHSPRFYTDYNG